MLHVTIITWKSFTFCGTLACIHCPHFSSHLFFFLCFPCFPFVSQIYFYHVYILCHASFNVFEITSYMIVLYVIEGKYIMKYVNIRYIKRGYVHIKWKHYSYFFFRQKPKKRFPYLENQWQIIISILPCTKIPTPAVRNRS